MRVLFGGSGRAGKREFQGLPRLFGVFARLKRAIPFEAIDDRPVDLVFVLLAPEDAGADHLKALARVSRLLRDRALCEKLRGTDNADALYVLLTDYAASDLENRRPMAEPESALARAERYVRESMKRVERQANLVVRLGMAGRQREAKRNFLLSVAVTS